ncbi:MAG: LTA synthase family protein, partial [Lysobacterales bacterium]
RDLLANLLLGAVIYILSRSLAWFLPAIAVLMAALHLANAGKVVVLGGPMMPDDVLAVRNLFMLLEGWQLAGVVVVVTAPFILLAFAIAWRSARTWIMLAVLALAGWGLVQAPAAVSHTMDGWFGNTVWNQRSNFSGRGLLVHLVQESARYLARGANPPTRPKVEEAMHELQQAKPHTASYAAPGGVPGRNVHVIVLESFWDPMVLTAAGISADPIDPAFRALWAQTGHSEALSPVFGGYTANAEFEILCGFPVTEDAVFFEGWLRRDAPCLPRQLKGIGYQSIASHPNIAAFWNRVNAYHRIGFDRYWSKNDFQMDDMNRNFLSDASYYRQVLQKIKPMLRSGTPIFNYMLTIFGHLDYPLNDSHPTVIQTAGDSKLVHDFVNTMYYKSRELMAFLAELQTQDPDAVIVLFGDHAPFLGQNFGGYTDSGLLADKRANFKNSMFKTLVTTPLVVIDGERGPVKLGTVPMYQIPAIILDLLGDGRPSLLRLAATSPGAPVRPLPGMYFLAEKGQPLVCRGKVDMPAGCEPSGQWLQAMITLTRDLFGGSQYTLSLEPSLHRNLNNTPAEKSAEGGPSN